MSPWVEALSATFGQSLQLLEAALTDCPDDLWTRDLWPDEAPMHDAPEGGLVVRRCGSSPTTP